MKASAREKLRYWFDNVMSRGPVALVGLLGLATVIFVLILAVVVLVTHAYPEGVKSFGFQDILWGNLMRAIDSGTISGDSGWAYRGLMIIVTVGGLIIVASLISIVSGGFDAKVEQLRKGRSKVIESDHTLILGWSSKIGSIISELVIANESRRRAAIVVLADRDKVEMEDELRQYIPRGSSTRLICRTGSPMDLGDLELAAPHTARSIVVLAPEDAVDADSVVIRTTLAITNNPRRKSGEYHIVGEISDPYNLEAARLVGRDEAHWVLGGDLISRVTVQTCRQSGLSVVYAELLDFDGDEIYFTEQPALVGSTYAATQNAFEDAAVMGLLKSGEVLINPPAGTLYDAGDQLIVIASDDSAIVLGSRTPPEADVAAISEARQDEPHAERTLFLGFNPGIHVMLSELAEYVAAGSSATVVADMLPPVFAPLEGMEVEFISGDTTSRALLDALDVASFDHIVVLAYREELGMQAADAKTLITLLHLRDIADHSPNELNVVSEMLDDRNRELAEVTKADDFIVSDRLISLMLSQVSENERLTDVFDTLFSSEGSEIYLRPAELYVREGASADFYTVLEAARRHGETAIGYRVAAHAHDAEQQYGVHVNPAKSEKRVFASGDRIIVLAEDQVMGATPFGSAATELGEPPIELVG